ncbi:MAG TPA: DUF1552 domain-containing protein [Gammaproteobacteria bacterium]
MFITKKHVSRRAVLRGAGVSIALPLLDAMIPAATALANTAAKPTPRLGFIYFPHGAVMSNWMPSGTGKDFELSPILAPLAKFREQMTVVSNLRNRATDRAASHGLMEETWLTGIDPALAPESGVPFAGVSVDQIAARHIGQDTPFPSLELKTEPRGGTHCYAGVGQPLPMEYNPRTVFYRLFGPGDSAEARMAILTHTGSILDRVQEESKRFQAKLGESDRRLLDNYLESVREIERRVQNMIDQDLSALDIPDAPLGVPEDLDEYMGLMFDLIALAYQANLTRVATFQMAMEISMRAYTQVGISEAFHPLSHHAEDPGSLEKLTAIQTYHSRLFARFIGRLAATPDGDGSLLDHSIILYGSNMSNSDKHDSYPLPLAVFGRGYGRIKGGQHLVYPPETHYANLLATLMERAGVPVEAVGDSTGELSEV